MRTRSRIPVHTEGEALYCAKDFAGALLKFHPFAAKGYAPALSRIGQMTLAGWGGPRNASKAEHYLMRAAEQGYAAAQDGLGLLHDATSQLHGPSPSDRCGSVRVSMHVHRYHNRHVSPPLNDVHACARAGPGPPNRLRDRWYGKAIAQGLLSGYTNLAASLVHCNMTETYPDIVALYVLRHAAAAALLPPPVLLYSSAFNMCGCGRYTIAARRGDPTSALQRGLAHLEGRYGLDPDPKLALYQIQLAVNLNTARAAGDFFEGNIPPLSPADAGKAEAVWLPHAKRLCTSV